MFPSFVRVSVTAWEAEGMPERRVVLQVVVLNNLAWPVRICSWTVLPQPGFCNELPTLSEVDDLLPVTVGCLQPTYPIACLLSGLPKCFV